MRGYTFECQDAKTRDELYEQLYGVVKDSEDFKLKDIVLSSWDRLGLYYCGIVIVDSVPGSYTFTSMNILGKSMKSVFIIVKAGIPDNEILIPDTVNISCTWKEDSVNRYKIYYQNFPFIKAMLNEGATPEKIEEVYGVKFTPEECEKIKVKEKP